MRIGNVIKVGGTIAIDDNGEVQGEGDMYAQTPYAITKIGSALEGLGSGLSDVVRTRIFVTNIDDWKGVARAHSEFFGDIRPPTTLVQISRLISPEFLIEIEAEAIVDN